MTGRATAGRPSHARIRERAHGTGARASGWLRVPRAIAGGLWTAAVCAAVAAALLPVLGLVPLAILRHHVRRALRSSGTQGTLATR
jgi:hypothetical protein